MARKRRNAKNTAGAAMRMTTAEAALGALLAHGIETIYTLPGVHNDDFFDALARTARGGSSSDIRVVHTRHEQGASYMALGAALATAKPQAYCVVPGPGLLNSSAALLTAYGMNAPVLALIGQIPHDDIGRGLAGRQRGAKRHIAGALLMAGVDGGEPVGKAEQRIEQRIVLQSGQGIDRIEAMRHQRRDHGVGRRHFGRRGPGSAARFPLHFHRLAGVCRSALSCRGGQ